MSEYERIVEMFQKIDENINTVNAKLDKVVQEMKQVKEENRKLKSVVAEQEKRIDNLEREVRKKNVVIKGVMDEEEENENKSKEKITLLLQKMGVNIDMNMDIEEIRRLGNYVEGRKRPIIVKLTKERTKILILQNARNLSGTDIWIDEDFSKTVQEERKALVPHLKEERKKGNRAYLRFNKLIVNGEAYTIKDIRRGDEIGKNVTNENNSQKRTITERSPEGNSFEGQMRKITRTSQKN